MTAYLLCGVIALLIVAQHFERRDLYNRLMSRNYDEYRRATGGNEKTEPPAVSAHRRAIKRWREGKTD